MGVVETLSRDTRSKQCRRGGGDTMETFVAKVKYMSGPRFDPLLEENGGWISGEAPAANVEMMEVVIESMAHSNK